MWMLVPQLPCLVHKPLYLTFGRTFSVGRKGSDILLQDASISRMHASLSVALPSADQVKDSSLSRPALLLRDYSRFGTLLSGERCDPKKEYKVNEGDVIQFGVPSARFGVEVFPVLCSTSNMGPRDRVRVIKSIRKIGGALFAEWGPACTHLVMNEVRTTAKLLYALIDGAKIVTPEFLVALATRKSPMERISDPEEFVPPLDSDLVELGVSLRAEPARKSLFRGLRFVFPPLDGIAVEAGQLVERCGGVRVDFVDIGECLDHLRGDSIGVQNLVVVLPAHSAREDLQALREICEETGIPMVGVNELGRSVLQVRVEFLRYLAAPEGDDAVREHEAAVGKSISESVASGIAKGFDKDVAREKADDACVRTVEAAASGIGNIDEDGRSHAPDPSPRRVGTVVRGAVVVNSSLSRDEVVNFKKFRKRRIPQSGPRKIFKCAPSEHGL